MAASVNKVILIGNLGRDPEIRTMQNGGKVASLSVATSESWKDKQSGEWKDKTEWHRVSVFNEALIGRIERGLKKGSKVYIEGALETRKYTDKDGQEKYSTEIVVKQYRGELAGLDRNEREGGDSYGGDIGYGGGAGSGSSMTSSGRSAPDLDDEIPF